MSPLQMGVVAAAVVWGMGVGVARAQEGGRAVVLGDVEPGLAERLEGQTADLAWSIERAPDAGAPVTFERALEVGAARGAAAVVWFERSDAGWVVSVAEVAERRLFARRVEAPEEEALGGSAALEAVALVVRGTLADLARGGHVGVVVPAPLPPPARRPLEPAPVPRTPDARVVATLGAAITIDGAAPRAHLGPALRVAVDVGPLELAIEARSGAPEELHGEGVTAIVTRLTARAGAALELVDDGEWRALVGATIGVVAHHRATEVRDPSLVPTGASTIATFAAAAELRAQWFPPPLSGALGVELAAGADVLAVAPRFVVERGAAPQPLHAPWTAQPTIALGLVIRAP